MVTSGSPTVVTGKVTNDKMARGEAVLFAVPYDRHRGDFGIEQSKEVMPGDVVVTPTVIDKMVEDIRPAAGLVVYNEYGLSSRGSVISRQIDAAGVVACPEVLFNIQPGDTVEVDGHSGKVLIH